ncbi:hypothetical protein [Hyphobacterium sp.]|uniref:hypothetical protein n=1 Tax=Hyphobacterium sp. TaxID=2004662 RepID=UPI003B51FE93
MTRAVAAQFQVLDANGDVVASGITGNEAISLAPGDYRIVAGDREAPAHIVSDEVTMIGLD